MNALEILTKGRELISKPKNWTQGTTSRDRHGKFAAPWSEDACSWCTIGALNKVDPKGSPAMLEAFRHLDKAIPETTNVASFNDTHTHSEVLHVWDQAIDSARNPDLSKNPADTA